MVYSNHFVMCVLVDNVPQEEKANGTVILPFGCEYILRFKNKHSRRACVQIFIDGENVSGNGYIITPFESVDIRRHNNSDRAFRFVSLDSKEAIEDGKNGLNDNKQKGVIEARFYLEKEYQPITVALNIDYYKPCIKPIDTPTPYKTDIWMEKKCGTYTYNSSIQYSSLSINNISPIEDGCTVEGRVTGQQFTGVYFNSEDTYTSLRLFLQGYKSGIVKIKYCDKCGAKALRKNSTFCHVCGSKLEKNIC